MNFVNFNYTCRCLKVNFALLLLRNFRQYHKRWEYGVCRDSPIKTLQILYLLSTKSSTSIQLKCIKYIHKHLGKGNNVSDILCWNTVRIHRATKEAAGVISVAFDDYSERIQSLWLNRVVTILTLLQPVSITCIKWNIEIVNNSMHMAVNGDFSEYLMLRK